MGSPSFRLAKEIDLSLKYRINGTEKLIQSKMVFNICFGITKGMLLNCHQKSQYVQAATSRYRKNAVSKSQLLKIQKDFAEAAPSKSGLSLSINVISNKKAITQTFLYKQETLGHVLYLINVTHDLLYNDKQYTISYSMGGSTVDSAIQNFEASERMYFTPMLVSFFLN